MRGVLAVFAAAGALLLAASPAAAAVDYFLQIDGVHGTSATRPGAIDLQSFSLGAVRGVSSPTPGASNRENSAPTVSEIVVTKQSDSASPLLFQMCASGVHVPHVMVYTRGGGQPATQYRLTDVTIRAIHANPGGGRRPSETMTLHFEKIEKQSSNGVAANP